MKIGIVGSGAIGLYYGTCLQRVGQDVHFLLRSDFEVVKRQGIRIKKPDGELTLNKVQAYRESDSIGVCDLVIVALKTTANDCLSALLPPLIGRQTRLLTLQNGLGNDALLTRFAPEGRILGGLCFICLNRVAPGCVENYFPGSLEIGCYARGLDDFAVDLVSCFQEAGIKCRASDDLALSQWKKLVWNVPFNGIAVSAGGITTDAILADDALRQLAADLMEEILEGAGALGFRIDAAFARKQIEITYPMGSYKPSSLIDYLEGKAVEVEAIWGEPYRQAKAAGVDLPQLGALYCKLKRLSPDTS